MNSGNLKTHFKQGRTVKIDLNRESGTDRSTRTNGLSIAGLSPSSNTQRLTIAQRNMSMAVPCEWNGIEMPFPRARSVLDFFREMVQSQPERLAIKEGQRLMTYRELDLSSSLVANELCRIGIKLEEPVVVFLPASCEFLVAIIGILKAGGAYFPVDMDTPAKRLDFLLGDSSSRLVLSNLAGMERLREWSGMVLDLNQILCVANKEDNKDFGVPSNPNRRAYIAYTSGSTGQPKGVEIEHHALTNLVCCCHERLNLTAQDRASMLSSVAFDASVADVWPTLCAGGTLTIPPKGTLLNPDGLIEWLAAEEITLAIVGTGLAEILFARPWPERIKLRFLITGGDRLRARPRAGLPFVVLNVYGPTENTVFNTWSVVEPEDGTGRPPTIGRPLANTTVYVLDERLQPVSVNVAGELYLGGEQVARGYLGRPELTEERFLSDPFVGKPDAKMYRTGDWVRWLADGELDFLGRKDGQIQIRGRRVELGEIEATLFAHDAVRQVCCMPWLDHGMPSGVIAHIVPETHSTGLNDELRAYLRARLPDYMLPSEFVLHENLPLTPHGKLDRAALTALQTAKPASPQIVTGEDGLEKALAQLWHSLLPAACNSPKDATFAALGGDSLLAIKLMLGVEEIIDQRLEVSTFMVKPTFAGLCEAVRSRMSQTEFQPVLTLRKHGNRPPLFCLYGIDGDIMDYFDLAEVLGEDQPVFGIRSSALKNMSRLPQSMEEAAAEVVRWIRKVQPQGVPSLVGYSWAGLLAFEVARQLAQQEGVSCFTAMIGSCAPRWPTSFVSRLTHIVRNFPAWLWSLIWDGEKRWQRLSRCLGMARRTKQFLVETPSSLPDWVSSFFEHHSLFERHMIALMDKYQPQPKSDVVVDLFRERDSYQPQPPHPLQVWDTGNLPDAGWNRWTRKKPCIHLLEGDHMTILKPPLVSSVAQSIRSAMDQHLKRSIPTDTQ